MRGRSVALLVAAVAVALTPVCNGLPLHLLLFFKTAGFTHGSIGVARGFLRDSGAAHNYTVDESDDASAFTLANLEQYDAVVFVMTTGDILNEAQQTAFEQYIALGRGFAGIHSATDTERSGWDFYEDLLGAFFVSHPSQQTATVNKEPGAENPSLDSFPNTVDRFDEWYNFDRNPRSSGSVEVLLTVDETSYSPGSNAMGSDHPIAWKHEFGGGRAWYTAMGHTPASYTSDTDFRQHLLGGVLWAATGDDNVLNNSTLAPVPSASALASPLTQVLPLLLASLCFLLS